MQKKVGNPELWVVRLDLWLVIIPVKNWCKKIWCKISTFKRGLKMSFIFVHHINFYDSSSDLHSVQSQINGTPYLNIVQLIVELDRDYLLTLFQHFQSQFHFQADVQVKVHRAAIRRLHAVAAKDCQSYRSLFDRVKFFRRQDICRQIQGSTFQWANRPDYLR